MLTTLIKADVYLMTDIPLEYRLQRISDGMFFGGVREDGEVCFCKDWNDVPYFVSFVNEDNSEGEVAFQWKWQIDECGYDMSALRMEDFRVHVVLGESGN